MENKKVNGKKSDKAKKSEGNNQWVSTGLTNTPDNRERRDGPGGENSDKKTKPK